MAATYGIDDLYEELTIKNIYSKVSDIVLWRYYLGMDFHLHANISSPLRPGDTRPSFSLHKATNEQIRFKDFATGQYGDIIQFLCIKEGITFLETLIKINCDFNLKLGHEYQQNCSGTKTVGIREEKKLDKFKEEFVAKNPSKIQVKLRKYTQADYNYWLEYGITRLTLEKYNVHCVQEVYKNCGLVYTYIDTNPCYGYYFPITKHIKCYWPLAKPPGIRFLGSVNNYEDIQGYYQCNIKKDKDNKLLILTKSLKDVMILRELGYEAMAIHGEGQYFYADFIRHIKKYYPRIISLYDRDKTGVRGARFLWNKYKIEPYFIDKFRYAKGIKDVSDMYKHEGREKLEEFMEKISMGHTSKS